jgi:hypothetical protein
VRVRRDELIGNSYAIQDLHTECGKQQPSASNPKEPSHV